MYKKLFEIVEYTKSKNITTSIISNGSLINDEWIEKYGGVLDWIGISVDSLNPSTNIKIGRRFHKELDYYELFNKLYKFKIKINTVVNRYNQEESLQDFIDFFKPNRWKVFETLRVEGQNDKDWEEIKCTDFQGFCQRHHYKHMVVEDNNLMTGSYLLIDPLGRLFENSLGSHSYSNSLIEDSFENCYNQLQFNEKTFIERGGIYNF